MLILILLYFLACMVWQLLVSFPYKVVSLEWRTNLPPQPRHLQVQVCIKDDFLCLTKLANQPQLLY